MARKTKNKGGRPPLPPEQVRSVVVQARATVAERDRWELAASTKSTTVSDEIRRHLTRWSTRVLGPETSPPASAPSRDGSSVTFSDAGSKPRARSKRPRD